MRKAMNWTPVVLGAVQKYRNSKAVEDLEAVDATIRAIQLDAVDSIGDAVARVAVEAQRSCLDLRNQNQRVLKLVITEP